MAHNTNLIRGASATYPATRTHKNSAPTEVRARVSQPLGLTSLSYLKTTFPVLDLGSLTAAPPSVTVKVAGPLFSALTVP